MRSLACRTARTPPPDCRRAAARPSRPAPASGGGRPPARRGRARAECDHLPRALSEVELLVVHVSGERVGRLRGVDAALRGGRAVDVVPALRRRRPTRARSTSGLRGRTAARRTQKRLGLGGQRFAGPLDDAAQRVVHVARRLVDGLVVVPLDDDRALGRVARDRVDDRLRIGAVSHQIAEEHVAAGTALARVPQAGIQRLEIGVDVGKQRDDQRKLPVARFDADEHSTATLVRVQCDKGARRERAVLAGLADEPGSGHPCAPRCRDADEAGSVRRHSQQPRGDHRLPRACARRWARSATRFSATSSATARIRWPCWTWSKQHAAKGAVVVLGNHDAAAIGRPPIR